MSKSYIVRRSLAMLCLLVASGCGNKSESSNVLENYTRVPYQPEQTYIDNDAYYTPPGAYYTGADNRTDIDLDPD